MKVWERIATFNDAKGWNKKQIAAECYAHKYCPREIEDDYSFIGEERIEKHCNLECGIECLEKYLDLETLGDDEFIKTTVTYLPKSKKTEEYEFECNNCGSTNIQETSTHCADCGKEIDWDNSI